MNHFIPRIASLLLLLLGLVVCSVLLVGAAGSKGKEEDSADDGGGEEKSDNEDGTSDPPPLPLPWEVKSPHEESCTDEEILILRDLRQRARELDRRDLVLTEREEALRALASVVEERMADLQAVRSEMLAKLEGEKSLTGERVGKLARMVDSMKATPAATMLAGMDEEVALAVLQRIKPKQAGKVLASMPPAKAQRLANRMTLVEDPRSGGPSTRPPSNPTPAPAPAEAAAEPSAAGPAGREPVVQPEQR